MIFVDSILTFQFDGERIFYGGMDDQLTVVDRNTKEIVHQKSKSLIKGNFQNSKKQCHSSNSITTTHCWQL